MINGDQGSYRVPTSEGYGIQLSCLRGLPRRLGSNIVFYTFLEDFEVTVNKRIILFEKGTTFFKEKDENYCSYGQGFFFFTAIEEFENKMFSVKSPKDYTLQDISDLVQVVLANNQKQGSTMIDGGVILEYEASDQFECAYVICPREVKYHQLVTSLNQHVQQKQVYVDEEDYYVWIDIFCSPHFHGKQDTKKGKELYNHRELSGNLKNMSKFMGRFQEVLIYFDAIGKPLALDRLWCVWELYMACKNSKKCPLSILFPSKVNISSLLLLDFDDLLSTVEGLDPIGLLSNDSSSSAVIRGMLTSLDEGFQEVQRTITTTLCTWLTRLVLREYETAENINSSLVLVTELYLDLGLFLINIPDNKGNVETCIGRASDILDDDRFKHFFKQNNANKFLRAKMTLLSRRSRKETGLKYAIESFQNFENEVIVPLKKELNEDKFDLEYIKETGKIDKGQEVNSGAERVLDRGDTVDSTLSFQSRESAMASGRILAGLFRDDRSNNWKLLEIHILLMIGRERFREVKDLVNKLHDELKKPQLYGGLSRASINFKYAKDLFNQFTLKVDSQSATAVQSECEATLNTIKISKKLNENYRRSYIREMSALYLAIALSTVSSSNVFSTIVTHFFKPKGKDPKNISEDDPFIIGCTERAAQVFFLLDVHAPDKVKAILGNGVFRNIAICIARALFGTNRDNKEFELYLQKLQDPIIMTNIN